MATATIGVLLRQVRKAVLAGKGGHLTDGQLLECYLTRREEAAFRALVQRHGPMVLAVCRRILGNVHDAEDAFQATFLVLVRKANSIMPREQVGNWLHGVAYRTAMKARSVAFKRQAREALMSRREAVADRSPDDWRAVLDQEVQRLPEKYRAALVLCDLEGKTRKEAAVQLGWAEGSVSTRLTKARSTLATRLGRRGVTLSAAALTAALAQNAAAAFVPASLVASTVQVQRLIGLATSAGTIPPKVAALMEGVLKSMAMVKLKTFMAIGLVALATIGVGIGSFQTVPADEPGTAQRGEATQRGKQPPRLPMDPLPIHALVSLDAQGRLVVKTAGLGHESVQVNRSSRMIEYRQTTTIVETRFVPLKSVHVFDTHARKIDAKKLHGLLKEEILALVLFAPRKPNSDSLQLIKEGTLVFQLPATAENAQPGYGYSAVPPVAPAPAPTTYSAPPAASQPTIPPPPVSAIRSAPPAVNVPDGGTVLMGGLKTLSPPGSVPTLPSTPQTAPPADAPIAPASPRPASASPPETMAVRAPAADRDLQRFWKELEREQILGRKNPDLAARDFKIAEFYQRTGHWTSASFCYELVYRRYPGSNEAEAARRILGDMNKQWRQPAVQSPPAVVP